MKSLNKTLETTTSIVIDANPTRVWEVMTKPELIKVYLHGTDCETNWKVGEPVIFQGAYEGHSYRDHGVVLENQENELLSYSYWTGFSGLPDAPENYSTVTYKINDLGNGSSEFSWIQKGYADEGRWEHAKSTMPEFLEHIKKVAEGK